MELVYPTGTIVYLKSGSPPLTVEDLLAAPLVAVMWFANGEIKRENLHKDNLTTERPPYA